MKFLVDINGVGAVFSGNVTVADEVYGVSWNGSTQVPTKNAVYDAIEALTFLDQGVNIISGTLQFKDSGTNQGFFMDSTTNETYIEGGSVGNGVRFSLDDNSAVLTYSANTITFPVATGTVALTSDIPAGAGNNIYNSDGSLTGLRTVTMGTNELQWSGTGGIIYMNSGRLGVQTPVFGGSRLGDNEFQAKNIDTQSILFKNNAQATVGSLFMNPTFDTFTIKNFNGEDNFIEVTANDLDDTNGARSGNLELGLTFNYTDTGLHSLKLFNNDLGTAPGTIGDKMGILMQTDGTFQSEKAFWFGRFNGTVYTNIMSVTAANVISFGFDVNVPDEAYGVGWDGSTEVPTKNAIYDKFESFPTDFVTVATTQTVTGQKTFSNQVLFSSTSFFPQIAGSDANNAGTNVGYMAISNMPTTGYIRLSFDANGTNATNQNVKLSNQQLTIPRIYQFPDANGTFALTSDIPGAGSDYVSKTAGGTFDADISVPDEVYGVAWNGSLEVPTKNAIYDKIETLGGSTTLAGLTDTTITSPADHHFLVHDGTDWKNRFIDNLGETEGSQSYDIVDLNTINVVGQSVFFRNVAAGSANVPDGVNDGYMMHVANGDIAGTAGVPDRGMQIAAMRSNNDSFYFRIMDDKVWRRVANASINETFDGTVDVTGQLFAKAGGDSLEIWGNSTGASNVGFISFNDNTGGRQGYVGIGSSGNTDIYLAADGGAVRFVSNGSTYVLEGGSGDRFGVVPTVRTDGVMEIGRYVDFHLSDASAVDNDGRLQITASGELDWSGNLTASTFIADNNSIEIIGASPRIQFTETAVETWYLLADGGNLDVRETNTSTVRTRFRGGGALDNFNSITVQTGNAGFIADLSNTNQWAFRGDTNNVNFSGIYFGSSSEGQLYLRDSAGTASILTPDGGGGIIVDSGSLRVDGDTIVMNGGNGSKIDWLNLTNADQSVRLRYEAGDGSLLEPGYALIIESQNAVPQDEAHLEVEGSVWGTAFKPRGGTASVQLTHDTAVSTTMLRTSNTNGYLAFGCPNTSFAHFRTDRPAFYFDKRLEIDTNEIRGYSGDFNLNRAGSTTARIRITAGATISDQPLYADGGGVTFENSAHRPGLVEVSSTTTTYSWYGMQIRNDGNASAAGTGLWNIMANATQFGAYDDDNNKWIWLYSENSALNLYFDGSTKLATSSTGITVTGIGLATDWGLISDERLKQNIKPLGDYPITTNWVQWYWKDTGDYDIGLIAQDLQKTNPEFVIESEDGSLAVSYNKVMVAKMAEKDKQVAKLMQDNQELKDRIERLEVLVKTLL